MIAQRQQEGGRYGRDAVAHRPQWPDQVLRAARPEISQQPGCSSRAENARHPADRLLGEPDTRPDCPGSKWIDHDEQREYGVGQQLRVVELRHLVDEVVVVDRHLDEAVLRRIQQIAHDEADERPDSERTALHSDDDENHHHRQRPEVGEHVVRAAHHEADQHCDERNQPARKADRAEVPPVRESAAQCG
ncbi:MAG: hypothetical protein ABJB98_11015 [Actinomycetota bacterium]